MNLKRREKILLGAVLAMVVLALFSVLLATGDSRSIDTLLSEQERLTKELDKQLKLEKAANHEKDRLKEWQDRSLPADAMTGRSLYQKWLGELAARCEFYDLNIHNEELDTRKDVLTHVPFKIRAKASLEQLVKFLFEFYSAGHLHQVRNLHVEPVKGSRNLDLTIQIEAVSLPGAKATDKLTTEPGRGLRLSKLSDYSSVIVKRNIFATPVPPTPPHTDPPRTDPPKFDFAQHTYVTALTSANGTWQVWVEDRTMAPTGKTMRLAEGEKFDVHGMSGRVRTIIPPREVIVEFDGKKRRLQLSDNLRGGVEVKE